MAEALLPHGYRLLALDTVGSTNDEAGRRAGEGETDGLVVMARTQSAGRGRRGRAWISPEGNFHASILVDPGRPMPQAAQLSFVTALALAQTLDGLLPGAKVQCKWPNDVLVEDGKIAGILLEGTGAGLVVVGIGVNLRHRPAETLVPARTLAEFGVATDPGGFLAHFMGPFDTCRRLWTSQGFEPIRDLWLRRAKGLGMPLIARTAEREHLGIFKGLDGEGGLLLESSGTTQRILAADVFFPSGEA